jgi:L-cysteine S-thiosulfotransferase
MKIGKAVRFFALVLPIIYFEYAAMAQKGGNTYYRVEGDTIPLALQGLSGDASRGRTIVANRQKGLCLLCHSGPFPEERFQGNLAPSLAGAGSRSSASQLRLRMVDSQLVNKESIMPAYHRSESFNRVAPAFKDKPILNAQEIEDVVAFVMTLKE